MTWLLLAQVVQGHTVVQGIVEAPAPFLGGR